MGKESMWTWGSAYIGIEGEMPRVLQVYSSQVNVNHKSGELRRGSLT